MRILPLQTISADPMFEKRFGEYPTHLVVLCELNIPVLGNISLIGHDYSMVTELSIHQLSIIGIGMVN
jgi:hypothetical protein